MVGGSLQQRFQNQVKMVQERHCTIPLYLILFHSFFHIELFKISAINGAFSDIDLQPKTT